MTSHDVQQLQQLKAAREHKFIEQRLLVKQWVELVIGNAKRMDPKLLDGVQIPEGDTAEVLLPALFATPFNEEQYLKELEPLNILVNRMNTVAAALNEEARKCLS